MFSFNFQREKKTVFKKKAAFFCKLFELKIKFFVQTLIKISLEIFVGGMKIKHAEIEIKIVSTNSN